MLDHAATHRPFDAYQAFVLDCKMAWTRQLFPAVRANYDAAVGDGPEPQTVEGARAILERDTTYQFFAWFERHQQRMKYSGRHGLARHYARYRDGIEKALAEPLSEGLLELDPNFEQPEYYTSVDIHQHPGGVWSDAIAGYVYERGARSTAPMLDKARSLHDHLMDEAFSRARRKVGRVADLGCGFGGSTRPFFTEHSDVDVVGLDLASPCLRLAAHRAVEDQARNVRFKQADAASTGLEAGAYDVVTSTMLLHEMPPRHIAKVLAESHRLLAPGGLSIHLDFLAPPDAFSTFIHYGHSARNNEPFMVPLNEMDLDEAHRAAGFDAVEIMPFEEFPGALAPEMTAWRFPWTLIVAHKGA